MPQKGFTLIELMVVIVIMAIMSSLVVLGLGGVDHRRAMQAREVLLLDLQQIAKQSIDQSRVFALATQSATDLQPFRYQVVEYKVFPQQSLIQNQNKWSALQDFPPRELPANVYFSVQAQDEPFKKNAANMDLLGAQAPQLIWFGNGDVRPVRIQFYFNQQPIGNVINIDYLGKINED